MWEKKDKLKKEVFSILAQLRGIIEGQEQLTT